MDSDSPVKTLRERQDDIPAEVIANEINFCTSQVREDIHSTFSRHRKSLASRERWLLDQLDNIKDNIMMSVFKHQISLAEMKGQLKECVRFSQFSKDYEFKEVMEKLSERLDPLAEKIKEYHQQKNSVPSVKFVHDKINLKNVILSYGSLETDFQPACADDTDSCGTEYSWDLVEEKSEAENCDKSSKNGFCVVSCMEKEIEDMDMSKLLVEDDLPTLHPSANALKNVCRANELCSSISDCVCDTPCLGSIPTQETDSVSDLSQKLNAIYQGCDDGIVDEVEVLQISEDPVLQISANVKNISSGSSFDSSLCDTAGPNGNDFIAALHQKLQSIIDGESSVHDAQKEMDVDDAHTGRVSYKSLPWKNASVTPSKREGDIVASLHERLGEVYQQCPNVIITSEHKPHEPATYNLQSDPILALSSQLQQIFAC